MLAESVFATLKTELVADARWSTHTVVTEVLDTTVRKGIVTMPWGYQGWVVRRRRSRWSSAWRARGVLAVVLALAPVRGVAAQAGVAPVPQQGTLVLDRVTVIDVEHGARLRDQRVVVVGNRIRALGSWQQVPVPPGARLVNARGQYLIPGLWDMHIHPSVPAPTKAAMYPQVHAIYGELIANGITGIRDAGAEIPLDTFRVWKREIAAGRRVGPRLIVSGPSIEQSRDQCTRNSHPPCPGVHVWIDGPEDAPHLVDSIKAAGADMIKIHNVSGPVWFAIAVEARRVGIPFGGHPVHMQPSDRGDGLMASDSGARIVDHGMAADNVCGNSDFDREMSLTQCAAAAARLRHNHTWIATWDIGGGPDWPSTPSVSAFIRRAMRYAGPSPTGEDIHDWRPLNAAERRQLPSGGDFAALLPDSVIHGPGCQEALLAYAADLPFMPGEDWPMGPVPGGGVHKALLDAVLCGVPPLWALQTATLNPVRALGATDSLGTVAVGKVADLVLLEGDPLEDIWNVSKIAAVLANGRYFDRAALDRLLTEAAANELTRQEKEKEEENVRRTGKSP